MFLPIRQKEKLIGWHLSGVTRTRIQGIRVIRVKMTEKSDEIQGKLDLVQVSREFKFPEFELLGFYCIHLLTLAFDLTHFSCVLSISHWKSIQLCSYQQKYISL